MMMKKIGSLGEDRRGFAPTDKIIILVLVALVILVMLYFIFRGNILDYLRNLPGYSSENVDREIELVDELAPSICPVDKPIRVADLQLGGEGRFLRYSNINSPTNIFINSENKLILYRAGWTNSNKEIGSFSNPKINIDPDWISGNKFAEYRYGDKTLPSRKFLVNLDGADVVNVGGREIVCREKELEISESSLSDLEHSFFFRDGSLLKYNFEYRYVEGKGWQIKTDSKWNNVANYIEANDKNPASVVREDSWRRADYFFVKSLVGKNYKAGLDLFVKRTKENKKSDIKVIFGGKSKIFGQEEIDTIYGLLKEIAPKIQSK